MSTAVRAWRFGSSLVSVWVVLAGVAHAAGGVLEGTVVDATGLLLPQVTISVKSPGGDTAHVHSSVEGRYRV